MDWTGEEIKEMIIDYAREYWKDCKDKDDFCIQHDGFPDMMVFGSTNRVVWRFESGYRIDRGYCTEIFLRDNKNR